MSVINQMLRDLDARDASEQERAGLPSRLRPLPPVGGAGHRQWPLLVAGIAIGALVAGIAASLLMGGSVVPTPTAVPPPTFAPPAAVIDDGAKKLSTPIRNTMPPAKPDVAAKAQPRPVPPPAAAGIPAVAAVAEKPAPVAAKPAAAPAVEPAPDVQIDKRPKGNQPHEQADAEYRRGMQAAKQGDTVAAAMAFRKALDREPGLAMARQALLATLVGGRQWAEARQVAEAGLALDPTQSGWAVILARLQFEQGEVDVALTTLERHAAHAGGDADYQGLFAYLLQRQQRPVEAAERFRAGLALRPGEGRWWFGLGLALENGGKPAEAKVAYARAREVGNLPADMANVIEQKLK